MDKVVIRRDMILEKMASRIFGEDIVDSAYITTWDYGNSGKGEVEKRLKENIYESDTCGIDIGAKDIIIKFRNGHAVLFTNSEWGSIDAIDMVTEVKEV